MWRKNVCRIGAASGGQGHVKRGRTREEGLDVAGKQGVPNIGHITEGLHSQEVFGSDGMSQEFSKAGWRSTKREKGFLKSSISVKDNSVS